MESKGNFAVSRFSSSNSCTSPCNCCDPCSAFCLSSSIFCCIDAMVWSFSGFPIYKTLLCRVSKSDSSPLSERNAGVEASIEEDACPVPHPAAPGDAARRVYLDYNATTFVAADVREAMLPFFSATGGNPSSIHSAGNLARAAVEAARRIIAQGLNCTARRVVFTGGGSEADNLAILGLARASDGSRRHLITSSIEHPAVLAPFHALAADGFDL